MEFPYQKFVKIKQILKLESLYNARSQKTKSKTNNKKHTFRYSVNKHTGVYQTDISGLSSLEAASANAKRLRSGGFILSSLKSSDSKPSS